MIINGYSLSSQATSILNINLIELKKNGLLRYHCGCQGNQAIIATGCMVSLHCPKEPPYQNMNFIQLKTEKLLRYPCGCHGNLATIA